MNKLRDVLRFFVGWLIPHSAIVVRCHFRDKQAKRDKAEMTRAISQKLRRANETLAYQDAVDFLVHQGCDRTQVLEGSIPETSLDYCAAFLLRNSASYKKPLLGLHVGNFVGISLAYFVKFSKELHADSLVVSIDPNLTHRGIYNPIQMVTKLLARYGLQKNAMILTGYSLEKCVSNDGAIITSDYDPFMRFPDECSCECVLNALTKLTQTRFDYAVIDGNHTGSYLQREIELIDSLLNVGGLLILDDIGWTEIQNVYQQLSANKYKNLGGDGRVGILGKL